MITRHIGNGDWQKILPGVYLLGHAPLSWKSRVMAAILWAGPGAVAAGRTAGALHDLRQGRTDVIEIAAPRKINSRNGIKVRHDPSLTQEPKVFVDHIPVTRISKTILDLCGCLGFTASTEVVVDAVRRRKTTILDLARILDEVGGQGKGGTRHLRLILTERFAFGVTDSDAEDLFIALAKRRGFSFTHHHVVRDPLFTAELDFADLPTRSDIEVDGGRYHDDPVAVQRDKHRDNELIDRGWAVLRFTYWDLIERPDWVFEKIESVLTQRAGIQLSIDEYRIGSQR
jgi:very-short-patch-repair endonuclease